MLRTVSLALLAGLLFTALAQAEDKPKDKEAVKKPTGSWVREVNNHTLTVTFRADDMTVHVKDGDGNTITITAAYGVTKDKVLFATMTKVEKKGIDGGPDKGDLFSFVFSVSDKELTTSDLKGTHVNEDARKLFEGVYKKK
jgi:hypothetical protein